MPNENGSPGWNPLNVLPEAIKRVPAVKYALGALGILGCVAAAVGYFKSPQVALVGAIAGLVVTCLMYIFSKVASLKKGFQIPALVFLWACLLLFVVWAGGMTSSVFFGWPLKMSLFGTTNGGGGGGGGPIAKRDYGACPLSTHQASIVINQLDNAVKAKQFQSVAACLDTVKKDNQSGVFFTVYPTFVVAFDAEHDPDTALQLLDELRHQIVTDVDSGQGFLSGARTLGWERDRLVQASSVVGDSRVRESVASLLQVVEGRLSDLAAHSLPAALDRGESIDGKHITLQDTADLREYVSKKVKAGDYARPLGALKVLEDNNQSGVNATVFPYLVLALDKTGRAPEARKLLDALMALAKDQMSHGGYYSRAEQRGWTIASLNEIKGQITDASTAKRVDVTIQAMQTGSFPAGLPLPYYGS